VKPAVLVTHEMFPEVLEFLRRHCRVECHAAAEPLGPQALAGRLADKDGALLMDCDRVDAALLAGLPRLKALASCGPGYANIDVVAATARGVLVTNAPGVAEDTAADHAFALVLACARRLVGADRYVREGRWQGLRYGEWLGADVHDAAIGIFGMGRVGKAVARRALGFSMLVLYHNRHRLPEPIEAETEATYCTKDELLRLADFVVLTLPDLPENHHYLGAAELALMKPSAYLVNIGGCGVVDDDALIAALGEGRIAGAGLDVFEHEPHIDQRLRGLDNVVLSPHIGSGSHATRLRMAMLAAENLVAALTDSRAPNLLNPNARGSAQ
jgi:lactate dehydrogenase-like 2-hydroxyacid dehydrogenase